MADLSKLTTEQLLQLRAKAPAGGRDLSGISTEDLLRMQAEGRQQAPSPAEEVPYHDWSELPGNIGSSAVNAGKNFYHAVTHPEEMLQVAQGAVDRVMPEGITDFLDTYIGGGQRTPEEKAEVHDASGAFGQQMLDRWGGFEKAKNTMITDPVGAGLEIGSVAVPAMRGGARIISPLPANAARTAAAETLAREGVDLTAGQRTGNTSLKYAESELGRGKSQDIMERQGEQFSAAALKRAGIKADRATPEVMDEALNRFDTEFRGLAQRNQLMPDRQMYSDLTRVWNDYSGNVPANLRSPIIEKTINDILQTASRNGPNGTNAIKGSAYDSLRSDLERRARGSSNPELTNALRGIRQTLDETMDRSIAQSNPRDLGAWRDVRNRYRNFLVIEQAATGAGENSALGLISPSQLRNATVQKHGRRNYGRGRGDLAELSRAGEAVMKPLPQSGTAPRVAAHAIGAATGGGLAALLSGDASAMGIGSTLGAAAGPVMLGKALMSRPVQAYLGNQIANIPALRSPQMQALSRALMTTGAGNAVGRIAGGHRVP